MTAMHDAESLWPVEDSGFLRTVPGPDEEKPYLDGYIRVLSVELYRAGIIVTWYAHSLSEEPYREVLRRPEVVEELEQVARRERNRQDVPEHVQETTIRMAQRFVVERFLFPTGAPAVDALRNEYQWRSSSMSGRIGFRGTVYFVPGLAPDAHQLTITLGEARFTLDV